MSERQADDDTRYHGYRLADLERAYLEADRNYQRALARENELEIQVAQLRRERDTALGALGITEGTPYEIIAAAVKLNDGSPEALRVFRHVIEQGKRAERAEAALKVLEAQRSGGQIISPERAADLLEPEAGGV